VDRVGASMLGLLVGVAVPPQHLVWLCSAESIRRRVSLVATRCSLPRQTHLPGQATEARALPKAQRQESVAWYPSSHVSTPQNVQ
jgi:hypothetical protein